MKLKPNEVIAEIQVRSALFQFGKIPKYLENITQEIVSIKVLVNSGMPMEKIGRTHPNFLRQLLRTTALLHKRHHPAYTTGCLFPNRQRDSRLV